MDFLKQFIIQLEKMVLKFLLNFSCVLMYPG